MNVQARHTAVEECDKSKKFVTPKLCANLTNAMCGTEGLSGREPQKAAKEGRVGVSPPRRG
jgi:hypothetical protein